jgi:hypothetical protein
MLRKYYEVKWNMEARKSFETIKRAFTEAPMLINLDYSKEFIAFYFALEDIIAVVQFQRNDDLGGYWWPPTYSNWITYNFHIGNFFLAFRVLNSGTVLRP